MSDEALICVHMLNGHFDAYKRWLAEHHLEAVGPLGEDMAPDDGEQHYIVGIADSHPTFFSTADA